jgi:hypothetical protein
MRKLIEFQFVTGEFGGIDLTVPHCDAAPG